MLPLAVLFAIARETYGVTAIIFVIALQVIALISLLAGHGSRKHKITWTLVIVLLPLIGVLLYVCWGRQRADRPLLD